jgi:hypothetical protein
VRKFELDSSGAGWGPMTVPFEQGNELSVSIKRKEFFDQLSVVFPSHIKKHQD